MFLNLIFETKTVDYGYVLETNKKTYFKNIKKVMFNKLFYFITFILVH